jgi:hypothetical protein
VRLYGDSRRGDMTYTEGAWYTERQEDLDPDGNGYVWAIKGRRLSDEKDSNGGWKHYVQNPAYANSEAHARLIASAPELKAALKQWISMAINSGLEGCDEILEQAEAAIAKATGQEEEVTA